MLKTLRRLIGIGESEAQLSLELEPAPKDGNELRARLVRLGLDARYRCSLTSNRTVFVSYSGYELRVHRAYLNADENAWNAIVAFVKAKSGTARRRARRELLAFHIENGPVAPSQSRAPEKTHRDDREMAERLHRAHQAYNIERFESALSAVPIRVSRRMKRRLGHYSLCREPEKSGEIVISQRHIVRHGWDQALETLVHEMVHQWQDETGRVVDHGREFKWKARAVGITPLARRDVA